jgi:hypothetical protein
MGPPGALTGLPLPLPYKSGYQFNKDFSPGSEWRTLRPQMIYDTTYLIRLFFKQCCNHITWYRHSRAELKGCGAMYSQNFAD